MKPVLAIVLCAIFSTTYALNDTDLVYAFVKCSLRAADQGVEGLIPPHNPLKISDVNITQSVLGVEYHFELTNNILYNLMDLALEQVDVTTYTNPGAVNIDYNIYWPKLNFTGDFGWYAEVLGAKVGGKGSYNIVFEHTNFVGLFNLTKPGQEAHGIKEHLDDFTLKISVRNVKSHTVGAGPSWLTDNVLQFAIETFVNNVPPSAADFLKEKRFNGFWIAHPEKIDAILAWCATHPA